MKFSRIISFLAGILAFALILLVHPFNFVSPTANTVLAVALWMIIWWTTEAAPPAVTALLPLVLFPMLNIMPVAKAAAPYANPIIFLFLGGFMIALAIEKHRLHERIALNLIRITGTSGNGIILGFGLATALLSMWISNTATAMMMLPIAQSIVHLIKDPNAPNAPQQEKNFSLSLMLMVGYAATLGGMATLIGTPPNIMFTGLLEQFYQRKIGFAEWMFVGVPTAMVLLSSTYFLITRLLFPNRIDRVESSAEYLSSKLKLLGPLTREEKIVLMVFAVTSFCWIFQQTLNEWLFKRDMLNDTVIGLGGGLLMFIIPVSFRNMEFILSWNDCTKISWGILILFGGGLCLAEGLHQAGLIERVGQAIASQSHFGVLFVLALLVTTVVLSELMSNVALVQVFVPVVFGIANGLQQDPLLMAMPIALAASIGFMFPIATPPNAIVFSSGFIKIKDMMKAGLLLDIVSIIILWIFSITLIPWVFAE